MDIDGTVHDSKRFAATAREKAVIAGLSKGLLGHIKTDEIDTGIDRFEKAKSKILRVMDTMMYGETIGSQKIRRGLGSSQPYLFNMALHECGITDQRLIKRYIAPMIKAYHKAKLSMQWYMDVKPVLKQLDDEGYSIYMASDADNATHQWDKIDCLDVWDHFEEIGFVTSDYKNKDIPESGQKNIVFYRKIIEELGVPSHCLIMVGNDPEKDIRQAKLAGINTVRVIRPEDSNEHFEDDRRADYTIHSLDPLLAIVKRIEQKIADIEKKEAEKPHANSG